MLRHCGRGPAVARLETLESRSFREPPRPSASIDAAPGLHQLVGPQVGVVVIVPAAGQARAKRRLERKKLIRASIVWPGSGTLRSSSRRSPRRHPSRAATDRRTAARASRIRSRAPSRSISSRYSASDELSSGWIPWPAAIMSRSLQRAAKWRSHDQRAGSKRGLIANGEFLANRLLMPCGPCRARPAAGRGWGRSGRSCRASCRCRRSCGRPA